MPPEQGQIYRFGEFTVDAHARTLKRNDAEIGLTRRSFDLLLYLVQNSGKVLGKDQLLQQIWPDTFVDENSLAKSVSVLRKALENGSGERSIILTLPGRGYQFAALVEALAPVEIVVSPGENSRALASSDPESPTFGVLQERRIIRTNIREVRQNAAHLTVRGWVVIVLLPLLGLTAAGGGGYLMWRHFHPVPLSASVVLVDFENTTGDKDFDYALKRAFQIELEQSPFLSILPRANVKETLIQMQHKPDEPLTTELAREVCERNNAQAVLSGSISRFAGKYLLMVDADSCVTGKSVAGYQQQVSSKDDVLAALDIAAGHVRKQLGESAASLGKFQAPIAAATTGSLEALRAYTLAMESEDRGDNNSSLALFERAVALDPNFASAYKGLSISYYNRNDSVQAVSNIQKAYDLRSHTTERERLSIEIAYNAFGTYDFEASIAAMRLYNQLYPNNASNWTNLCAVYTQAGEYPQAVEAGEFAWRLAPHTSMQVEILARAYKRANRFADAKRVAAPAVAEGKDSWGLHSILFQIAFAEQDAARIKPEGEWGFTHQGINRSLDDLGWAAASAGKLREAASDFSRAQAESIRNGDTDYADGVSIAQAEILAETGNLTAAQAQLLHYKGDGGDIGNFAILEGELGNLAPARKFLADMSSQIETNSVYLYCYAPILRALLALSAHNPSEAVADLEQARNYQLRDFGVPSLRAQAETEAGMLDKAAEDYRLILANQGVDPISPLFYVAHLRLARVLVLERKPDQARSEYQAFLNAWKDADSQAPLLLQAREEYSKLMVP